jgi:hypothetical protein
MRIGQGRSFSLALEKKKPEVRARASGKARGDLALAIREDEVAVGVIMRGARNEEGCLPELLFVPSAAGRVGAAGACVAARAEKVA